MDSNFKISWLQFHVAFRILIPLTDLAVSEDRRS